MHYQIEQPQKRGERPSSNNSNINNFKRLSYIQWICKIHNNRQNDKHNP